MLSDHFSAAELRCSHCWADGLVNLGPWRNAHNVAELEAVRAAFNQERARRNLPPTGLPVNSGHRCALHPIEAAKDTPGQHNIMAVDFGVFGFDAPLLTVALVRCGWTGIGWQQKGSGRYVHADKGAPRAWSY